MPSPSRPVVTPTGDGIRLVWPESGWGAVVERFVDSGKDSYAEATFLKITGGGEELIAGPLDLNLKSESSGASKAKHLASRCLVPASQEKALHEYLATLVGQTQAEALRWRRRPPVGTDLSTIDVQEGSPAYLVEHLILDGAINTLVADGSGGKSYIGLALAVSLAQGRPLVPRFAPLGNGPVLYFDFEWDGREHARRLWQISRGLGLRERPAGVHHYPFTTPLRHLHGVGALIHRERPCLVVVDSLGYALGGDVSAQADISQAYGIMRAWNTTVLVLHHENREKGVFGSIYIRNSTRNMWLMQSVAMGGGALHIEFKHEKINGGEVYPYTIGLRLAFSPDARELRFHSVDRAPTAGAPSDGAATLAAYMGVNREVTATKAASDTHIPRTTVIDYFASGPYEKLEKAGREVRYRPLRRPEERDGARDGTSSDDDLTERDGEDREVPF